MLIAHVKEEAIGKLVLSQMYQVYKEVLGSVCFRLHEDANEYV